jgi:hypothetical protein
MTTKVLVVNFGHLPVEITGVSVSDDGVSRSTPTVVQPGESCPKYVWQQQVLEIKEVKP